MAPALLAADGEIRIERLVPQETVLAASIDNCKDLEARLRRTPLWGLLNTSEAKKLWQAFMDDMNKEGGKSLKDQLAEFGLSEEKLAKPEGTVGMAMFLELDEEKAVKVPAILALADFGENADKAQEMFDAILEKAAKDGGVKIEDRTVRGRKVRSVNIPRPAPADPAKPNAEEEGDEFGGPGFGDLLGPIKQIRTVHLCRDGKRFMASSSLIALEDALEVVDGQKLAAPLAESKDFAGAIKQLGDGTQGWAVLLTGPAQPLFQPLLAGPGAMALPLIGQVFGDIRAYSFGLGVAPGSEPAAAAGAAAATTGAFEPMLEETVGIYVPGDKVGLLSLVTDGKPKGDVPAHVGPDTVSFARMSAKFAGVMPLVNKIVKGLPPMFAEQIEMQLQQFGPALEKGLAELGPEVYVATTQQEPLTAESQRTSVAIKCAKPDAVRPLIDLFAPAMGLQPQDFVGQTIYADELSPEAIGLGTGWLVLGPQLAVEGVLRASGQKDLPLLADDKLFKRSLAALPGGDLVGWGWSNTIAGWKYRQVANKAMLAEMRGLMDDGAMGIGGAVIDDLPLGKMYETITPELLAKYVGPSVWSLKSINDGFVYRTSMLGPE